MVSTPQPSPLSAYLIAVVVWVFVIYMTYQRNRRSLHAQKNSRRVRPNQARFLLSWLVYSLVFYVPLIFTVWLLGREFPKTFAWAMFFIFLSIAPAAYPYYTVALFKSKINGATQWGWGWKRIEIALNEINVNKTMRQPLGKAFSIRTLHSTNGAKILTLGLNEQQIFGILKSRNEVE